MTGQRDRLWPRLFLLSFASLFLEVMLIRWISVEIRIFSYFRNVILIGCFLGLGIGFNLKRPRPGLLFSLGLTLLLAALVHPGAELFGVSLRSIPDWLNFSDFHVWYESPDSTWMKLIGGFALTTFAMLLIAVIFVPFGQLIGEIFEASDNRIIAYCINLAGSLAGTWFFALLSFLNTPPWIWFLLGGIGLIPLLATSRRRIVGLALMVPLLLVTMEQDTPDAMVYWSPYQKLMLKSGIAVGRQGDQIPVRSVQINSVLYMFILDLSRDQIARYPRTYDPKLAPFYPYDLPFRFQPRPRRVLIMGAGAGNDAAGALRNGAGEIDAVEIDPVIARLGRLYHPEHPYDDPRVHLYIDDARSFYKKTDKKYDLIIFALLDSHTLTSNFTNINLDSYLYTYESFEEAKEHLAPGGLIALSFQVAKPWLGDKLYDLLDQLFGEPPLVISNYQSGNLIAYGTGGRLYLAGDLAGARARLQADPELRTILGSRLLPVKPRPSAHPDYDVPTDNWPYLYVQSRRIPTLHLVMLAIIGLLMLAAVKLVPPRRLGPSHFLFLGAGFMLVETHSITKAALLFGSTWVVNVVMISAILVMILGANLVALRWPARRPWAWYAALFAALAMSALVPVDRLLVGGWIFRGIVAGAFYSLPLFFAGVIFARSISRVASVEAAFAANMFGAALGGMLESSSYLLGLRAVVFIAIGLYAASAFFLRRMPERPA